MKLPPFPRPGSWCSSLPFGAGHTRTLVLLVGSLIGLPRLGLAQNIRSDLYVTNGTVNAVVEASGTIYIGGYFTPARPAPGATGRSGHAGWPAAADEAQADHGPEVASVAASAPDGTDGMFYVWQDDRNGASSDIYAQRVGADGGKLWSATGVPVCAAAREQVHPALIPDGAGGTIIAWDDVRDGASWSVYAQRLSSTGVPLWTQDGVLLCTGTQGVQAPSLVPDGAGGAIIAWQDVRSGPNTYAQRVNGAGEAQWAAGGVALGTSPAGSPAAMIADGAGGAIVGWYGYDAATVEDIHAQRVDSDGHVLWGAGGRALPWPGRQHELAMLADGAGAAILAWSDGRREISPYVFIFNVYTQRLDAAGVPQWTSGGVVLDSVSHDQFHPIPITDGAGGAIIMWTDAWGGPWGDLKAQRVDASGAFLWAVGGVTVCAGTSYSYSAPALEPKKRLALAHASRRDSSDRNVGRARARRSQQVTSAARWRREGA